MKRLLFAIFFLVGTVSAQNVERETITGLRGLDTRSSDFGIRQGSSRIAHNADFGTIGSVKVRKGRKRASTMAGQDSILHNGLFGVQWRDGQVQMAVATDSTGTGYGGVYLSQVGSSNIEEDSVTKIANYWGAVAVDILSTGYRIVLLCRLLGFKKVQIMACYKTVMRT